jgi:hypothetical protein
MGILELQKAVVRSLLSVNYGLSRGLRLTFRKGHGELQSLEVTITSFQGHRSILTESERFRFNKYNTNIDQNILLNG